MSQNVFDIITVPLKEESHGHRKNPDNNWDQQTTDPLSSSQSYRHRRISHCHTTPHQSASCVIYFIGSLCV